MLKYLFFVKKRDDLTFEEFSRYSREVHAPIVSQLPGLKKYVVTFNALPEPVDGTLSYDSVAEVWFETAEDFQNALGSEIGQQAGKDRPNFLDDSQTRWMAVEEYSFL